MPKNVGAADKGGSVFRKGSSSATGKAPGEGEEKGLPRVPSAPQSHLAARGERQHLVLQRAARQQWRGRVEA